MSLHLNDVGLFAKLEFLSSLIYLKAFHLLKQLMVIINHKLKKENVESK